jgi:hypothetical protein
MSKEKIIQPAFPTMDYNERVNGIAHFTDNPGMDLRDYFAAKAMQTIMVANTKSAVVWSLLPEEVANQSYLIADAMLAERSKNP